jgi:hypothetical protein
MHHVKSLKPDDKGTSNTNIKDWLETLSEAEGNSEVCRGQLFIKNHMHTIYCIVVQGFVVQTIKKTLDRKHTTNYYKGTKRSNRKMVIPAGVHIYIKSLFEKSILKALQGERRTMAGGRRRHWDSG